MLANAIIITYRKRDWRDSKTIPTYQFCSVQKWLNANIFKTQLETISRTFCILLAGLSHSKGSTIFISSVPNYLLIALKVNSRSSLSKSCYGIWVTQTHYLALKIYQYYIRYSTYFYRCVICMYTILYYCCGQNSLWKKIFL